MMMTIGELAQRTGVAASALRYYEQAGLLPEAKRVNGRRAYEAIALRQVEVLRFAQQAGFSLAEIRLLFGGFRGDTSPGKRWRSIATAKLAELDALVAQAAQMRLAIEEGLRCGCMRLEDCSLKVAAGTGPDRGRKRAPLKGRSGHGLR